MERIGFRSQNSPIYKIYTRLKGKIGTYVTNVLERSPKTDTLLKQFSTDNIKASGEFKDTRYYCDPFRGRDIYIGLNSGSHKFMKLAEHASPEDALKYYKLAFMKAKLPEDKAKILNHAITTSRYNGNRWSDLKDYKEAMQWFETAVELTPADDHRLFSSLMPLANLQEHLGNTDKALATFKHARTVLAKELEKSPKSGTIQIKIKVLDEKISSLTPEKNLI